MENFGHTHKPHPRITRGSRRTRGNLIVSDSRITSCREQPWEGLHVRIYICQEIGFRLYINLYAYTQMELAGLTEYVANFTVVDSRINSGVLCREKPWEGLHVRIYICQEIGFRL